MTGAVGGSTNARALKDGLEKLYRTFDRSMLSPDPLECVPEKGRKNDMELSAFIAASFAYGKADLIVRNVCFIIDELGPQPVKALVSGSHKRKFKGWKYRFHKRADLMWFFDRLRAVYSEYGSLEKCFCRGRKKVTLKEKLASFSLLFSGSRKLSQVRRFLVPSPVNGSACKRMNLFLRWMIRKDSVDLGLWKMLKPPELVIPLDVHVHRIAARIGLVSNGAATFAKAQELTENLRKFDPDDPVRYDFALCSLGKLGSCLKTPDPQSCMKCVLESNCAKK
ncbi:MAG: TIGR02757 family protein [Nitrospinota bacterium]